MKVSPTQLDRRVALVIGNSRYRYASKLTTPKSDAKLVARALHNLGFQLHLEHEGDTEGWIEDAGSGTMRSIVSDFMTKAAEADAVAVYFAGHGIEFDGQTFLLPVDANFSLAEQVQLQCLSLDWIMNCTASRSGYTFIMLDCCRVDEPSIVRTGNAPRNHVPPDKAARVLVALATAKGAPAQEGSGNSPFAKAIANHLDAPNQELRLTFGAIRDQVVADTQGQQVPYVYESLGALGCFLHPTYRCEPNLQSLERQAWQSTKLQNTVVAYDAFLNQWAHSTFEEDARRARKCALRDELVSGTRRQGADTIDVILELKAEGRKEVQIGYLAKPRFVWLKPGDAIREFLHAPEMVLVKTTEYILVGKFPVTQSEWKQAQSDALWSAITNIPVRDPRREEGGDADKPVVNVSWHEADAYARWLSAVSGKQYRLLTELEWDQLSRAEPRTVEANLASEDEPERGLMPVGSFPPNQSGLHDMIGNVWEWCDQTGQNAPISTRGLKPLRGGSWRDSRARLAISDRILNAPSERNHTWGFRVARVL